MALCNRRKVRSLPHWHLIFTNPANLQHNLDYHMDIWLQHPQTLPKKLGHAHPRLRGHLSNHSLKQWKQFGFGKRGKVVIYFSGAFFGLYRGSRHLVYSNVQKKSACSSALFSRIICRQSEWSPPENHWQRHAVSISPSEPKKTWQPAMHQLPDSADLPFASQGKLTAII